MVHWPWLDMDANIISVVCVEFVLNLESDEIDADR